MSRELVVTYYSPSAMFAKVLDQNKIDTKPIKIGNYTIEPGTRLTRIGATPRTAFETVQDWCLSYSGKIDKFLLFTPQQYRNQQTSLFDQGQHTVEEEEEEENMFYCFMHVGEDVLLIQTGDVTFRDIKADFINFV